METDLPLTVFRKLQKRCLDLPPEIRYIIRSKYWRNKKGGQWNHIHNELKRVTTAIREPLNKQGHFREWSEWYVLNDHIVTRKIQQVTNDIKSVKWTKMMKMPMTDEDWCAYERMVYFAPLGWLFYVQGDLDQRVRGLSQAFAYRELYLGKQHARIQRYINHLFDEIAELSYETSDEDVDDGW